LEMAQRIDGHRFGETDGLAIASFPGGRLGKGQKLKNTPEGSVCAVVLSVKTSSAVDGGGKSHSFGDTASHKPGPRGSCPKPAAPPHKTRNWVSCTWGFPRRKATKSATSKPGGWGSAIQESGKWVGKCGRGESKTTLLKMLASFSVTKSYGKDDGWGLTGVTGKESRLRQLYAVGFQIYLVRGNKKVAKHRQ